MNTWKQSILLLESVTGHRDTMGRALFNAKLRGRRRLLQGGDTCTAHKNDPVLYVPNTKTRSKYFNDPCRFIGCWVRQKKAEAFPGDDKADLRVSDNVMEEIGRGSFGRVFKGQVLTDTGRSYDAIVKENYDKRDSPIPEAIIQIVLFCHLRGVSPKWMEAALSTGYARIPKIIAVSSKGGKNRIAMQPLPRNLWQVLHAQKTADHRKLVVRECVLAISVTLKKLQEDLSFEHRDLHLGNIMVRGGDGPGVRRTYFLIDMGYATMKFKGTRVTSPVDGGRYGKRTRAMVPGGDIAQLMLACYEQLCKLDGRFHLGALIYKNHEIPEGIRYRYLGRNRIDMIRMMNRNVAEKVLDPWAVKIMMPLLDHLSTKRKEEEKYLFWHMYEQRYNKRMRAFLQSFDPAYVIDSILAARNPKKSQDTTEKPKNKKTTSPNNKKTTSPKKKSAGKKKKSGGKKPCSKLCQKPYTRKEHTVNCPKQGSAGSAYQIRCNQ